MDEAGLEKLSDRAIRQTNYENERRRIQAEKAARAKQRRQARLSKRYEKGRQRLHSFDDLKESNRKLVERAQRIHQLAENFQSENQKQSPWIILHASKDAEHGWVAGFVEKIYAPDSSNAFGYAFFIYAISKKEKDMALKEPLNTQVSGEYKVREQTFFVSQISTRTDEIYKLANERAGGGVLTPVNALRRYVLHNEIENRLDTLGATLTLFEQASTDPVLNPHLVPAAEQLPSQRSSMA